MRIKVLQATHPDMIKSLDTEQLRELYLASEIFAPDEICLTYSHVERFIIGGAMPATRATEARRHQGGRLGSVPGAP